MGYNLHLYCETCDEYAFVERNGEAVALNQFARRHQGDGHAKAVAADNGYPEPDWVVEHDHASSITLPLPGSAG
jgi:hypothetical protein